jgi:5-methylcytosine-specific restriction endonuclease McrA
MNRPSACRRGYGRLHRRLASEAITRHPWCEDCGATNDLTGDHRIPLSLGGMTVPGNYAVRCRPCNARKGNRPEARTQLTLDSVWSEAA